MVLRARIGLRASTQLCARNDGQGVMTAEVEGEICVLGGGPAGSVIARRLAELGHDLLLLDRTAGERRLRVESLAASILPVLDSLQLRSDVDAAVFCSERHSLVLWGSGDIQVKSSDASPSLLVERTLLDDRFRDAASRAGVRIIAPARARAVQRLPSGKWLIPVATSNGPVVIKSTFLVDARGKRHHMCIDDGAPQTVALSAQWSLWDRAYVQTRIEAGSDEWFWGSPLPDGSYAATIFLDSTRVAGLRSGHRARMYRDALSRSKLLQGLLHGKMIGSVGVRDATPRVSRDPIGKDFIRVGEASIAIDPLSSQGIQTALLSAVQGSAAVHTILSAGYDPVPALEFYRERQLTAAARHAVAAARFHQAAPFQSSFWLRRSRAAIGAPPDAQPAQTTSTPSSRLRVAQALKVIEVPVLSGGFIRRAPALCHPALKHPIAYFAGIALAPLLHEAGGASTADQILQRWTRRIPAEAAASILTWMWSVGILVAQADAPRPPITSAH
jgi:flavin-dependent dehydrogenase